jgi:hypothetical protein
MKFLTATFILIVLTLVCSLSVKAQDDPPPPPPPAPRYPLSAWKEFKSSDDGFAVSLPAPPTETNEKSGTALGDVVIHTWRVITHDGRYQVMAVRFPFVETDPQKVKAYFDRTQTQLVSRFNGKPEGVRDFELNEAAGREFRMQIYEGKGTVRIRLLYRFDRVWILISDTINREPALKEPDLFHDSFRLTEAPPVKGPGVPGVVLDGPPPPAAGIPGQTKSNSASSTRSKKKSSPVGSGFTPPPSMAPSELREYYSREGGFSVLAPAEPTKQEVEVLSDFGPIKVHLLQSISMSPIAACTVMYSDYPDEAAARKIFDQRSESIAKNGKIVSDKEISLDGYPGSEMRTKDGPGTFMVNRMILVKKRVYQVMTVSQEADVDSPQLRKFLESFRLKPEKQ